LGSLITFRPEIKILDCTIRDGGLMNAHKFEDPFVKRVFDTCVSAGVSYIELGYKASRKIFNSESNGKWKFCDEEDLKRVVGDNKPDIKISVMADAERTDYHNDILPKDKSVIDCIRVATYINQIPTAIDMVKDAHDKGYETSINLMAMSTVPDEEINEALEIFAKSPVDMVYIVDSFGSYYPQQIREITQKFVKIFSSAGKEVGIHAHNNQQLAFANTIEAIANGANRADATINGFGRGAGNCALELLLSFLRNPKFELRPVIDCVQDLFVPLKKKIDWGYSIPYLITGMLNQHPRSAMELREGQTPDDFIAFFDKMME
jgi:4-hydroxy 2-oxovalerate aldolase